MYQPLADLLRPQTLDEVYGQEHILGKGAVLRRLIDSGNIPNMVFYGPSGTGKTTVANIIAKQTNRTLYKLNATTASTADIKEIVAQLDTFMAPNGVLLYLDEIQSFNKKQQQSLLEHIENGKITLIASTTENPYFYVFNAILSRSTVFEFKQISASAALQAVRRAVSFMEQRTALTAVPEDGALEYIASSCGGDLRKAMNAVEVLFSAGIPQDGKLPLTLADAKEVTQKSALRADRDGDNYYDLLSALHKSIRGSDPDAACHYLARLLEAGQMPSACRRLMCVAAEDVGLAYPQILPIVNGHRMQPMRLYNNPIKGGKLAVLGGFSPADLAAMAEFIPPADPKREEAINKLAPVTKPLLPAIDPTKEKKEAKDPEDHKDRTVISTRRGRL